MSHTKLRGLTSGTGIATGVKGSGQDPSGNSRILLLSSNSQELDSSVLVITRWPQLSFREGRAGRGLCTGSGWNVLTAFGFL